MKSIEVVAAVIVDDGKIFATQRGYGEFKDGWEFPGGKMEAGESPQEALVREIREELATEIQVGTLLKTVEYDYPDFHLTLHCYLCSVISGELVLLEHEAARWLASDQLDSVAWLPADLDLIRFIGKTGCRITPDRISQLEKDEIFVFGSNIHGHHGGGAARFAMERFGAEWGKGEGLQGQCYALPTMEGMANMKISAEHFISCARQHPELKFFLTEVACGIAGYTPEEVAPLFEEATSLKNVWLPRRFWEVLTNKI